MNKAINKLMTSATTLVLILALIAGYFMWATYNTRVTVDVVRNNLKTTQNELDDVNNMLLGTREKLKEEILKSSNLEESLNNANTNLKNANSKIKDINSKLNDANKTIKDLKSNEYKLVYLGDFKLTHYCCEKYKHICGTGTGITATGTKVTAGRTIAVDPKVIPYGTKVYIEGYGWRTAEDCGGAVKNKQIDIAVDTHQRALSIGTRSGGVWILVRNS